MAYWMRTLVNLNTEDGSINDTESLYLCLGLRLCAVRPHEPLHVVGVFPGMALNNEDGSGHERAPRGEVGARVGGDEATPGG